MSTTSIMSGASISTFPGDQKNTASYAGEGSAARREATLLGAPSLIALRRQVFEALILLAAIIIIHRWFFGVAKIPGLPHPYWFVVLLVSGQYGVGGGLIASLAATVAYWFELSPASATQDFYAYAGVIALQPGEWLATALVLGGLRSLHIHQSTELADQLATYRLRASDLGEGLKRAMTEIDALERRIALDMGSVAAFSRSLSLLDLSDRAAAARTFSELFRVGTSVSNFTVYLKESDDYVPAWAIQENSVRSTGLMKPISASKLHFSDRWSGGTGAKQNSDGDCHAVFVPPLESGLEPLALIICKRPQFQDAKEFRRRADELSAAFAAVLRGSHDSRCRVDL